MQNHYTVPETAQSFAYERKGNSAVIWRCFSHDTRAYIPAEIDGLPVKEIAPYAFSAHMEERTLEQGIQSGKLRICVPEFLYESDPDGRELPPALCGNRLEGISFPQELLRVGRYCFYNCDALHSLEFWGALADWGTGVFTGCHRIREIRVHTKQDGSSSLKQVLDEVHEELRVTYCFEGQDEGQMVLAHLLFPEFYEEGIENTPARILETHVHGSGMMYRNCFQGRIFDFRQYDTLFPHAVAQESQESVSELVLDRLQDSFRLSESAKEQYLTYMRTHAEQIAAFILDNRDIEKLQWFLENVGKSTELTDFMVERASKLQFAEALGMLMEFQRAGRPKKTRRRMEL